MSPRTILLYIALLLTVASFFAPIPWQVPVLLLEIAILIP